MTAAKRRIEPRPGSTRGNAFNDPRPGTKWHALLTELGYRHGAKPVDLFGELVDFHEAELADQYEAKGAQLEPAHLEHLAIAEAANSVAAFEAVAASQPRQAGNPGRETVLELVIAWLCAAEASTPNRPKSENALYLSVARKLGLPPSTVRRASRSAGKCISLAIAPISPQAADAEERADLRVAVLAILRDVERAATRLRLCNNSVA